MRRETDAIYQTAERGDIVVWEAFKFIVEVDYPRRTLEGERGGFFQPVALLSWCVAFLPCGVGVPLPAWGWIDCLAIALVIRRLTPFPVFPIHTHS
ncbi:hypothetical protein INR49_026550, partial [Caranx melampygus]